MSFEKIAIGIRTFLRDDKLFQTINAIGKFMPSAKIIIADCGRMGEEKQIIYSCLRNWGHTVLELPFDSGYGAMSNAIADALDRPYLLIGSDDFDFDDPNVSSGIIKLQQVLERGQDIASGRVNNRPYEFNLEITSVVGGQRIKEIPLMIPEREVFYWSVDLTVNYSLIRRQVFQKVRWDVEAKIGQGEHGAWFYDAKKTGQSVAFVPGVNINPQRGKDSEEYMNYRRRALSPDRLCFDKRGIVKYILGNGTVDYEAHDDHHDIGGEG